LWAVFVDFSKAFDTVHRDLLLERCRTLGIHGAFLDALVMLYDVTKMRVAVNGRIGREFQTFLGTKQGSELSPLLFGLFMDLLHELIIQQVPGAGPTIGSMSIPDLMYADDVCLLSTDPAKAQQLLDCLSLFCTLFGMEVNLTKTCVVVFRKPGAIVPRRVQLVYRGQALARRDSFCYLGVLLHETKGFSLAADTLAVSGRKALYAMLAKLRLNHITQFDMQCRMFDVLVEPVLSYGSHIWGPEMCVNWLLPRSDSQSCGADKVHFDFLRWMYGAGKRSCKDVLLKDTHRAPMPFRWLSLASNWWHKMQQMSSDRLAHMAWCADIDLMLEGCTSCWTYNLLSALESCGFIQARQWRPGNPDVSSGSLQLLDIDKGGVWDTLLQKQRERWSQLIAGSVNPRSGPRHGTHVRTHDAWVHTLADGVLHTRKNAPRHMKICLSSGYLKCLAKYRLGGQHLVGRLHDDKASQTPALRGQKPCKLCSVPGSKADWQDRIRERCGGPQDEDLLHFLLECPAYDHIRESHRVLFGRVASLPAAACMRALFQHRKQILLAKCVWRMDLYRRHLLGLYVPCPAQVQHQPIGYSPSHYTFTNHHDFASCPDPPPVTPGMPARPARPRVMHALACGTLLLLVVVLWWWTVGQRSALAATVEIEPT
jgi:hypothetical protein